MNLPPKFRSGYAALLGRPSVGKSTLLNAFLKSELSIVTPKPQTTREKILGIVNGKGFQLVLVDTPGLLAPRYLLQKRMVGAARSAAREEADLVCLLVEPAPPSPGDAELYRGLDALGKPLDLVINKVDTLKTRKALEGIEAAYRSILKIRNVWPISALKREGVDALLKGLVESLPEGQPYFPVDQSTDRWERFFATEIIRKAVFDLYGEEVPFSTAVELEDFRERPGEKDLIRANLIVERPTQKGILVGKGGQALKRLGETARHAIEKMTGRPARLELWVKVIPHWRDDPKALERLGY